MPATYHVEPFTSAKRHQLPSYRVVGRSTPLHLGAKAARPRTPRLRPSQALSCLDPPERIDHTSAVGGLFEAEPCHRRWSRFPVSPSAGGASRLDSPQKGPLPLRQPERFALALGDGQHISPDATKPDGITGAAGRVATATAFTAARSARLRSRSALRRRSRFTAGCASRSRRLPVPLLAFRRGHGPVAYRWSAHATGPAEVPTRVNSLPALPGFAGGAPMPTRPHPRCSRIASALRRSPRHLRLIRRHLSCASATNTSPS